MKIASCDIAMTSDHRMVETDQKQESLRYWTGDRQIQTNQSPISQLVDQLKQDLVEISDTAKQLFSQQLPTAAKADGNEDVFELGEGDKQKIQMIQDFIRALTGKKSKSSSPMPRKSSLTCRPIRLPFASVNLGEAAARPRVGWGLNYEYHASHYEKEQTAFASSGTVKTADGREIKFDLAYATSREYSSRTDISIKAGDALVDPLVINFAVPTASLTAGKYAFDLDSDGDKEQISFVGQGSGFLALDKNGDGAVNNGSELFGPESGNGFADLAAYDADGNNWIDENDAIYSQLSIWTKDENGGDRLLALGQTGVGAIYLGNVGAAFSYKDTANQLQGQLQRSGVFLHEDGRAGTIQQIDLAV